VYLQCAAQILDYALESYPNCDRWHEKLVGNYMQDVYLREGKKLE
jgi:hypothetical protein